ncbi:MAG TPA: hypothetical protein VEY92_01225 [Pseudoxanthomonas sp.]|nr:hypothetical protein [Pseudoxanthomonas sp.]
MDQSKQGELTLRVHLVNTGRIAIEVKQVFLAGRAIPGEKRVQIYTAQGYPRPRYALLPRDEVTLSPAQAAALREVVVQQPITIVAESKEGRRVKTRCPGLRKLYAQLQSMPSQPAGQ